MFPTADHEVVEVDGFVFRRKRRVIPPTAAPPETEENEPLSSPAAIKMALQLDGSPAAEVAHTAADESPDVAPPQQQATAEAVEAADPVAPGVSGAGNPAAEPALEEPVAAEELDMVPATQVCWLRDVLPYALAYGCVTCRADQG